MRALFYSLSAGCLVFGLAAVLYAAGGGAGSLSNVVGLTDATSGLVANIFDTAGDTFGNPSALSVQSWPRIFNGTNYDRQRSAGIGNEVASLGLVAQVPYAQYSTSQLALTTNGRYSAQQLDNHGALKVVQQPNAINYYSAAVNIRQTAVTAANATVWTMRNPAGSAKTVYIESIGLNATFDSGTPVVRTTLRYQLGRFSAATPTGGTAVTVVENDNANSSTAVTDARFLDTGLTTTSVIFESPFSVISVPAVDGGAASFYAQHESIPFVLAAGEGLAIRLNVASAAGQGLSGVISWSER